jgi:hypothetical protein
MASKAEIGWVRQTDDGERFEHFARHVGKQWRFFKRQRRFDQWERVENPPLEDWRELLERVRRRVVRRLYQPDDVDRLVRMIRERFPEAEVE